MGRAAERAALRDTTLGGARLVTLVGPGGVGKTRLATTVARDVAPEFPSGVAVARLASVRAHFLTEAIAAVLGVTERPGEPLAHALRDCLGQGRRFLLLDTCEHLLEPVADLVSRLLTDCPELVVLATSRQPLGTVGERVLALRPLPVDGPAPGSNRSQAVALLVERARTLDADLEPNPHVADLCRRVGGLPLAIELAAAGVDALGLLRAHASLDRRIGGGDRDPADAAEGLLQSVIDWSYALLDCEERRLFRRLGVFARGFDLDAVTRVGTDGDATAAADLVRRLVGKALLVAEGDPAAGRWQILDPLRAYALDRLGEAGEELECRRRHLGWAAAVAVELEHALEADRPWQSRFDLVVDDLRAALASAESAGGVAHRLAHALGHLCYARQFLLEARQHFQHAAACAPGPSAAAADLRAAADVAMAEHRGEPAFQLLKDAAECARSAGDGDAQAIALASAVCVGSRFPATFAHEVAHEQLGRLLEGARCLAAPDRPLVAAYLAAADAWHGSRVKTMPHPELARAALEAARAAGDTVLVMAALDAVMSGAGATGRFREAQRLSDERLQHFARLPRHDPRTGLERIDTLHMAPLVAVAAGELHRAVEAARLAWDDPFSGLYMRASKQVVPLLLCGRFDDALGFAATMWDGWRRVGRPAARWMAPAVHAAALAHGLRGQVSACQEWRSRALALAAPRGQGHISDSFAHFAEPRLALHVGALDTALATAVDLSRTRTWSEVQHQFFDAYAWAIAAEVGVVAGLPDAGERLAAAAAAGEECAWAAACLLRARGRMDSDPAALRESLATWDRIGARFERACTMLLLPDRAAEGFAELSVLGCQPPARLRARRGRPGNPLV